MDIHSKRLRNITNCRMIFLKIIMHGFLCSIVKHMHCNQEAKSSNHAGCLAFLLAIIISTSLTWCILKQLNDRGFFLALLPVLPLDGMARNYYFHLDWCAGARILWLDPFYSYFLILEEKKDLWSELESNTDQNNGNFSRKQVSTNTGKRSAARYRYKVSPFRSVRNE